MKLLATEYTKADIDKLQDDDYYFGEEGAKFLSKSKVKTLIKDPSGLFDVSEKTIEMHLGTYLHQLLIEPSLAGVDHVYAGKSRKNKGYQELKAELIAGGEENPMIALQDEVDVIERLAEKIKVHPYMSEQIFSFGNRYEVANITEVHGILVKGKTDVLTEAQNIDIKTTGDISRFKWSAKDFYYDVQAFLYRELFGKPMTFFVACKKTEALGVFTCSEDFYRNGERRFLKAVENYRKYYINKEIPMENFLITEEL